MTENKANDRQPTTVEGVLAFGKFILICVAVFAAASLVVGTGALLWPESTLWVLSEHSGWKSLALGASFGIWLILGVAAFVFKYIPVLGAALAFMARVAFMAFVALLFISALPGLLSMPTITGTEGAL